MSATVQEALRAALAQLKEAGIEGAARDARLLMAARLGLDPGRLTLHLQDDLAPAIAADFAADIARRAARAPVSHILGYRDFYGRRFCISPDVLDPRPETETLIAAALELPFADLLDLGTGSGAILLTLLAERLDARGTGADLSAPALEIARANARALGLEARCKLLASDWCAEIDGKFDLITSNPPYIAAAEMGALAPELAHEPRMALTDEADGLSAYRAIARAAPAHLRPGGWLMVEIGWQQGAPVAALFAEAGLAQIAIRGDLDGRDRVVLGQKIPD